MGLLLHGSYCGRRSGALIDLVCKLKYFLEGFLAELLMCDSLLHSRGQLSMPKAKNPSTAAASFELMLTHVIDEVIGKLAGLA